MESNKRKYDLEARILEFSLMILSVVEKLPETKICNHLGGQLLRSGTSPALNYGEAQAAESRKDFVHKLKVILKELRETHINLKILDRKSAVADKSIIEENNQLIAIFMKSISTAKKNESNTTDSN